MAGGLAGEKVEATADEAKKKDINRAMIKVNILNMFRLTKKNVKNGKTNE